MSTITTRSGKGSPLTHDEVDANFNNLNTDKYQSGDSPSFAGLTVDTDTLYVDSTNNRVGIGTSSLEARLEILTGISTKSWSASTTYGLLLERGGDNVLGIVANSTSSAQIRFGDPDSATSGSLQYDHSDNSMRFRVNESERLRIDSSGKVGIGTTSPSTALDVAGTVTADGLTVDNILVSSVSNSFPADTGNGQILATGNGGSAPFNESGSLVYRPRQNDTNGRGNHYFYTGATPKLRQNIAPNGDISFYDSTGTTPGLFWDASQERLGIGTSSPSTKLDVVGDVSITETAPQITLTDSDAAGTPYARLYVNGGLFSIDSDFGNTQGASYTRFTVDGSEAMRINSSGNVGIGTSNPTQAGLVINNSGTSGTKLAIKSNETSADTYLRIGRYGTGDDSLMYIGNNYNRDSGFAADYSSFGVANIEFNDGYLSFGTGAAGQTLPTEAMRITSTGNVGIGTTSPSYPLDVSGIIYSDSYFRSANSYTVFTGANILGTTGGITSIGANPIVIGTDGTERMKIDSSGNVGIGTSSPATALDVTGTVTADGLVVDGTAYVTTLAGEADTNTFIRFDGSDVMVFRTGNAERMRIDSAGNVGIGTSNPAFKLDVFSNVMRIGNGAPSYVQFGTNATDLDNYVVGVETGSLAFYQGKYGGTSIERMRIDSSGRLLVNTTSDVLGNNPAFIVNGTGYGNVSEFRWTGTNSFYNVMVANGNGFLGGINTNGTTTSFINLSDYRVKENINPMVNALDKIELLKPCTFTYKTDGKDGQGFIAHELQEVFPDAVVGKKDEVNSDGKPVYQGVDTSFLVATLTAAIQEQQAIIESLTARVTALES